MLTNKQVPVLNLTKTSITSQADLQDTFQSLCLCSHGRKESTEDKSAESIFMHISGRKSIWHNKRICTGYTGSIITHESAV